MYYRVRYFIEYQNSIIIYRYLRGRVPKGFSSLFNYKNVLKTQDY